MAKEAALTAGALDVVPRATAGCAWGFALGAEAASEPLAAAGAGVVAELTGFAGSLGMICAMLSFRTIANP